MTNTATLEPEQVAKRKPAGNRKQDEQSSARIAKDLLRDINIICKARGVSVTDYIDGLLRPAVKDDFAAFMAERSKQEE